MLEDLNTLDNVDTIVFECKKSIRLKLYEFGNQEADDCLKKSENITDEFR
jgi:hypothetical protein